MGQSQDISLSIDGHLGYDKDGKWNCFKKIIRLSLYLTKKLTLDKDLNVQNKSRQKKIIIGNYKRRKANA